MEDLLKVGVITTTHGIRGEETFKLHRKDRLPGQMERLLKPDRGSEAQLL